MSYADDLQNLIGKQEGAPEAAPSEGTPSDPAQTPAPGPGEDKKLHGYCDDFVKQYGSKRG
jgi:hypothetical protein